MKESYICGNNLLEITTENGTLTAETIIDFGKAKSRNHSHDYPNWKNILDVFVQTFCMSFPLFVGKR